MSQWHNQAADKELSNTEVHIWLNYLNLHQAKLKHIYPLLSDAEKARSEQFKHYKHRKLFIAAHGFMHSVLGYYLPCDAADIQFKYGDNGKPFLLDEQNPGNIQFNLSHANNLSMLAVCIDRSVGIDIEYMERKTDWMGIIKRFFTANEQAAIFKLPQDQQKAAFYCVWTRKEAHMKVTGEGLHLSPTQFEVSTPPEAARFIENLKQPDNNYYKMQDLDLPDMYKDYYACVSADFDYTDLKFFVYS